jgi:uncharacterized RDD family membrane protein YckC
MAQTEMSGSTMQEFCPSCGIAVSRDYDFCPNCGYQIYRRAAQPPVYEAAAAQAKVEYMGFWVRALATLIDSILLLVVYGILFGVAGLSGLVVYVFIAILYPVLFIGLKGQTLGKMALGMQVVDTQGNVPGLGKAALREIVGKFLSGLAFYLGFLWIGWDREKRGWHDHIAGTFVIRKTQRVV